MPTKKRVQDLANRLSPDNQVRTGSGAALGASFKNALQRLRGAPTSNGEIENEIIREIDQVIDTIYKWDRPYLARAEPRTSDHLMTDDIIPAWERAFGTLPNLQRLMRKDDTEIKRVLALLDVEPTDNGKRMVL